MDALVAALDRTWSDASALLHAADDPWAAPTGCPGWTVQDQLSHLVWSAQLWCGNPPEEVAVDHVAHVATPVAAYMEWAVEARRSRAGADVLAEFDAARVEAIDDLRRRLPDGLDEPFDGPMGHVMPRSAFLGVSVFDQWTHVADIATALGQQVDLRTPGADGAFAQIGAGLGEPLAEHRVEVRLTGGRDDVFGPADPVAVTEIDALDLLWWATGRDVPRGTWSLVSGDHDAVAAVFDRPPMTP